MQEFRSESQADIRETAAAGQPGAQLMLEGGSRGTYHGTGMASMRRGAASVALGGDFWNTDFGAARAMTQLPDVGALVRFFREGAEHARLDPPRRP